MFRNFGTTNRPENKYRRLYRRENFSSHKDCNISVQDGAEHAEAVVKASHSDGGTTGDCPVGDGIAHNCDATAAMRDCLHRNIHACDM